MILYPSPIVYTSNCANLLQSYAKQHLLSKICTA
ncbi:unnamed protein product [Acanthoscelides obtectus]|uniref:Uncharacterized protein n=1 Tax=Acanthoscelides obtectus TaxID=200917 RepID=A0A9P0JSL4_ACAOB|nr:unnamed protein product [Acanthoscelides obtectus]